MDRNHYRHWTTMHILNHLPKSEEPGNRRRDRGQLVCSEEQGLVKGLGRSFDTFSEFKGFRGLGFYLPPT